VDRAICGQPSTPGKPDLPHPGDTGNSRFAWVFPRKHFLHRLWVYALALFLVGWTLQFIGHAFEHKEPEFFHDWRFLFVGVRWWWAKIHGKA
jgi:Protein of unknown function (DUF962)